MKEADVAAAIEQLGHALSAKRRSAAKALRKLQDPSAGPALLQSLQDELRDARTWETQYQMVMALGACRYVPALPFLQELARRDFEATMVYIAIGDALLRLATSDDASWQTLTDLLQTGNPGLAHGACQAIAMQQLVPPQGVIEQLFTFASRSPLDESQGLNPRFWIAAAAPGWLAQSPATRPFLQACTLSKNGQLKLAAEAALQGRYLKWSPL